MIPFNDVFPRLFLESEWCPALQVQPVDDGDISGSLIQILIWLLVVVESASQKFRSFIILRML